MILNRKFNSTITGLILVIFFSVSMNGFAQAPKAKKDTELNGKTFDCEVVLSSSKKAAAAESDQISFKSGKLKCKMIAEENGFTQASYTTTVDSSDAEVGKVVTFEAEIKNSDGDILTYSGTVTGEQIEGSATWTTKKQKIKKEYSYTGVLKEKKK